MVARALALGALCGYPCSLVPRRVTRSAVSPDQLTLNSLVLVSYDGSFSKGSCYNRNDPQQSGQPNATVEGLLEVALRAVSFDEAYVCLASRTDKGVSANMNYGVGVLAETLGTWDALGLCLGSYLRFGLRLRDLRLLPEAFRVPWASKGMVCDAMAETRRCQGLQRNATRRILHIGVERLVAGTNTSPELLCISVLGESFLYRMVRYIVFALVLAGRHRATAQSFSQLLAEPKQRKRRKRTLGLRPAPAHGLQLAEVTPAIFGAQRLVLWFAALCAYSSRAFRLEPLEAPRGDEYAMAPDLRAYPGLVRLVVASADSKKPGNPGSASRMDLEMLNSQGAWLYWGSSRLLANTQHLRTELANVKSTVELAQQRLQESWVSGNQRYVVRNGSGWA
eukprot:Skav212242  [mRNA]  locus=scaffold4106:121809:129873:+ [translate_table: standard]